MLVFPLLLLDETLCSRLPAGCAGGGGALAMGGSQSEFTEETIYGGVDGLRDQGGQETSELAGSLGWWGSGCGTTELDLLFLLLLLSLGRADSAGGGQGTLGGVVGGVRAEQHLSRERPAHLPGGVVVLR